MGRYLVRYGRNLRFRGGWIMPGDESVTCWGRINYGNKGSLLVPTGVPGIAKAKRLFAVGTASCATIKDGSFVCWGDVDHSGHLKLSGGTRANRVPTPSRGVDKVVAVHAAVKKLNDLLKTEFVTTLNLDLPLGAVGDND